MRHFRAALIAGLACALPAWASDPFPLALGGPYELVDQYGATRSQADPDGRAQLVFFGYINCPDICTAALPMMAQVVDALADSGHAVTPVMITISPDRDRVETMGTPLAELHGDFIGLTGDKAALAAAYEAFGVEITPIFQDPEYGWIYAHGSFIHLLDGNGDLLTLIPPILSVEQAAGIAMGYLDGKG
ncbi:SCO family protein [Sulfitobacter sp. JB4-11]|uniref:SCO family protein n=1 Tax=Sulfitobacter rhodophyticola TaxID=3238304 RepID=UPI003514084D